MINTHLSALNGYAQTNIAESPKPSKRKDKVLKILMLEDNDNDAELLLTFLKNSICEIVSSKEDYIKALDTKEFDVILSDHNLPQFNSLEALKIRNAKKFHVPFILVSGTIDEEYAVRILQAGANDYIIKDRPQRLMTAINEAIKKQKAIADKIYAESELIKSNERLRLVGKATADAIWDLDLINNTVFWGEGYETLFGYKLETLSIDLSFWEKNIHPDDYERVNNCLLEAIKNKDVVHWNDEYRYRKASGNYAYVTDKGILLRDKDGKAYRMVGALQDITHIRGLERQIQEQKLKHQKENTEIALQAQEAERDYIAKELHDNINQLMAFSKMMLDTARNSPDIREMCMDKSYEGINLAIEEVRKLSHSMIVPQYNESYTFIDAVNEMAANVMASNKIKIKVKIVPGSNIASIDKKITLTFYRIIQEQLNNILKYANATKASIALKVTKHSYHLVITDNGVGFDCKKIFKGIGLRNIASRAEVHGGNVQIISAPGQGCTLKIDIPFP